MALTRRLTGNWMMQASFSGTSKNNQNVAGLPQDNPNADFNQADRTFEWISKLSGSYRFPFDIQASALFELRSGEPWARTVLFSGGTTIPTLVVNVEPIGTRSYPNVHHLDVRLEKAFRLVNHEVALRFNVYNALNSNMTITANTRAGSTFGRPLTILPPRLAEISASYKFLTRAASDTHRCSLACAKRRAAPVAGGCAYCRVRVATAGRRGSQSVASRDG